MIKALKAYFWPEMAPDANFDNARTRLACGFSFLVGFVGLLHSAVTLPNTESPSVLMVLVSVIGGFAYFALPALWHKTRNLTLTAWALALLFWVHFNCQMLLEPSHEWRREIFLLAPATMLLILVGRASARVGSAVSIVNFLALALFTDVLTLEAAFAMIAAQITFTLGLAMYFDEVRNNEHYLTQLRDDAQRADREKSEFLANMSHEIRTPLNGLSGVLQLLEETDLTPEQAELVAMGRRSGVNLMRLINDVLDYSKIAADGVTIEQIPFESRSILATAAQSQGPAARTKGLSLEMVTEEGLPEWLIGDPTRLNQVLSNLLNNAIKFSSKGSIRCEIAREGDFVKVSVKDDGIGLTQEAQGRIFNKFEQASTATNRQFGGTGLGLAICKELVGLLGGEIGVISSPLMGSTFWFTFPLCATEAPNPSLAPHVSEAQDSSDLAGTQVLVVEDNKTNQLIARRFLESMQINVDVAEDGRPALQLCAERSYDLILMDIQLLELGGVETTEILRAQPGPNQHTPIVALSANILPEQTNAYLKAGMNACLGKPYRKDELRKVMSGLLGRQPKAPSAA
jgi:signal transduction histidine kinase/CheY-like chemotaxis protein